ncbi:unnamed protein product [Triticum turgidum subsp. durum]|uniref:AMP-dependent synthetase/ligase domain-containing protein n=1 Tax=Triticum turgidum subsp. durum TaxID=4567 RepID=A0A9R0XPJ5_TRITD|nr:unnamed protein product [Triticum turgidum subsp. durum]
MLLASSGQMAALRPPPRLLLLPPRPAALPLRRRPGLLASSARRRGGADRVCVPRCAGATPPPQTSAVQIPARRKCSPFLDSALLPGGNELAVHEWKAVPDIWRTAAEKYADRVALVDPYHDPPSELTYKQLEQQILDFSHGLRVVGVAPDEKIALFADNSCRWLVADQGIMATGAINVVRGTKSSDEELFQIYSHSESIALVVDSPQFFNRLAESFISRINARFIVLLWGDKSSLNSKAVMDIPVYDYNDITELGRENRNALCYSSELSEQGQQGVFEAIGPEDVATLIYTSGTGGTPKGVMLTHRNLLHQINNLWDIVPAVPGDRFLSMLPPWHAYERSTEYFIFTHGIQQVYTTVKHLKADLQLHQPHYIISVPLVYETLHSSIQRQISASSPARKTVALALIKISLLFMEAKKIYEAIGIKVQNGYGLTETSPVVAARRPFCNVLGTVGHPIKHTEIKIVDIETGEVLPDGSKGIVKIKGLPVMKGYYKNPSATNKALDLEGWFNTGDIGWIAPHHATGPSRKCGGMLVLEGRAKDTIVLTTGENVEPAELEEAASRSSLIDQIMVIGQDRRRLGAIIVPNNDEVVAAAKRKSSLDGNNGLAKDMVMSLLYAELKTWMAGCSFQIGPILVVDEPFTIDNGLMTPTMKIRRDKVAAKYQSEIEALYK